MGLGDVLSRVITEYKADTSDMKAGLKGLQGEQKALAEQELAAAEARNSQMEDWVSALGKATVALAAVGAAAKLAFDGYETSLKESRLETAAMGVDLDKLSAAAGGLQTHMQLLEFAAKVQTSAFHATNEQMQVAERFMRQLEARGVPTAEAYDAVTSAITTGRVKGLIPYGVVVNTHLQDLAKLGEENLTLAQKTELVTGAYQAMANATSGVVDGNQNVGDSMKKAQVDLANSWEEMKKGLGQLVVAMEPLIEALAKAVGLVAKIAQHAGGGGIGGAAIGGLVGGVPGAIVGGGIGYVAGQRHEGGFFGAYADAAANNGNAGVASALGFGQYNDVGKGGVFDFDKHVRDALVARMVDQQTRLLTYLGNEYPAFDIDTKTTVEAHKPTEEEKKAALDAAHALIIAQMMPILYAADAHGNTTARGIGSGSLGAAAGTISEGDLTGHDFEDAAMAKLRQQGKAYDNMMSNAGKAYDAWNHKVTNSLLEKTFGPVGEFDLYKKGFEALSGAVGTAYDAMVSGSESAGVAVRKFIAQSVEDAGKQMAVEAIKEGAYALGSLALGDVAGASAHGAAAAEFAAGAVIAGVVASELGYGSSTSVKGGGGSGGKGGSGGGSGGASGAPAQQSRIIVIGETFNSDTPRMQALKAKRWVALADGGSGYEDS